MIDVCRITPCFSSIEIVWLGIWFPRYDSGKDKTACLCRDLTLKSVAEEARAISVADVSEMESEYWLFAVTGP